MKRARLSIVTAVILLILPAVSLAQEGKGVDGSVWKQLNADNKALFTLGYFTGIQILAKFAPGPCNTCPSDCMDEASAKLVPVGTAIPEVVKVVDSVYQDPANAGIPVQWVLKLTAQKMKGMSEEDWKNAIADARDGSAPAAPPAPPTPTPAPKK